MAETLLELRDEANFLNLEELSKLCTEELSKYTPGSSTSSSKSASSSMRSSKRPSITHAQSHHQLGRRSKNLSIQSVHQFVQDPNEIEFDTHNIPTPNSSTPSSREGSRHEATIAPTPPPFLTQLRGHGKSYSNVHPLSSKSATELRSDPSMTVKARPSPAWL